MKRDPLRSVYVSDAPVCLSAAAYSLRAPGERRLARGPLYISP